MPAEHIICIHQGEDGTVCGEPEPAYFLRYEGHMEEAINRGDGHPFVPGGKCPTCDGSGKVGDGCAPSNEYVPDCPTCAGSPVRGYVPA